MPRAEFIKSKMGVWTALKKSVDKVTGMSAAGENETSLLDFVKNYRRTISDYSLLRSWFPGDPLIRELNALLCKALLIIGRNPLTDRDRMTRFYSFSFPEVIIKLSRFFLLSTFIFLASALFGYFITMVNPFFANAIVGDEYIYMTIDNIRNGTPFAVYQAHFKYAMSGFIMANNIKVAFYAFSSGVFYGVGTFLVLISNGLMLGSITAVFASHNLLWSFLSTVLVHGTLELFAIMVAGAAGLRLGQSLFRPGHLTRKQALASFGREAFILTAAMTPVFIIAGILEGYVTPLGLSAMARCGCIGGSALFLTVYLGLPVWLRMRTGRVGPVPEKPAICLRY
jgi:uncharacterized membrane protein SpoIIM required for sporulation